MLFNLPDGKPLCFPSFLPRAAFRLVSAFLLSSLPPPYLLLSSPFHLLFVPFSLYPSLSSFYLVANCFFFLVTRFDQRFPMSSFLRHEEVLSFANPLAVILESREREGKRQTWMERVKMQRQRAKIKTEEKQEEEKGDETRGRNQSEEEGMCRSENWEYIYIYTHLCLTREKLFPSSCLAPARTWLQRLVFRDEQVEGREIGSTSYGVSRQGKAE